ncbi:ATP-dependent DNA helicase PIF1 [Fusarium oxysporum f. sp. raphani]|uniref:ATP-dependent DNA helicase n=1 Tax=Fusarium oxysporum f. sp. raphani TaxID=96318 RepID=A0A8J5NMR4_FUSOX|nr:ATP-dependent DNA helicase PIF1 [Fusarium oxysporum f. sp. raphani]
MPRPGQTSVPLEDVRRTLESLDRQHIDATTRLRRDARVQQVVESERQNEKRRMPLVEVTRTLEDLERRHIQDTAHRRQGAPLQTNPAPQTRNERHWVALEEILRVSDDLDRRRAECQTGRPGPGLGRPHQAHRRREWVHTRVASGPASGPTTPEPASPLRTSPSLKRRSSQQDVLLAPPPSGRDRNRRKRPKLLHEVTQHQRLFLDTILQHRDSCFRVKEDVSLRRSWCKEVPLTLQVETSRLFHTAFADERTLPISHCTFCYRKCPPANLNTIRWKGYLPPSLLRATAALQECKKCLPPTGDAPVHICLECRGSFDRGKLPKACSVNNMNIGCEHRYPKELDGLSPLEERLIALQAPFGYITKFSVDNKTPSSASYRKHVKGHIVVFPNSVEDLVTTVLPHPLLQTIENIHVSWSGANKPNQVEVGSLLQVRKSRVIAALLWLQKNNPLYRGIEINLDEIHGWKYAEGSAVPAVLMERMQREEPSAVEKTHTDPIVPNADRGLEGTGFADVEELLASMQPDANDDASPPGDSELVKESHQSPEDLLTSAPDPGSVDRGDDTVCETSASGMFPLDGPAAFAEADKLSFLTEALRTSQSRHGDDAEPSGMMVNAAGDQPFIRVERGADFADNLHEDFFPRTFPKLFPWGRGGPKALSLPDDNSYDALGSAQRSNNHSLNYWTKYVLQRHGGRFAVHAVFCFLVFNILLRSTNRRISMVRLAKGSFGRLDQVCGRLTMDRLKTAQGEMQDTKTTTDRDVLFLLHELSIFGHAQPLSNETRLLMRRKIQSLNIWTGIPAIWITVNPNDINNPVKLKLSIHRLHDHHAAKELLIDLRGRYDRIALSIMDPVSAAIFFHREISLFFEKYVRTGQESVYGKISHYYATVETNDRGSLHLHGLLWLEGNMELPSLIDDMAKSEEGDYRTRVVRYLDSVFNECLDEEAGRAVRKARKLIDPIDEIMNNTATLAGAFDNESNFIAYCCQVHSHTYTCVKYSLKALVTEGAGQHRSTACRFKAPWKLVENTGFTEDGLLRIRRNHPLVNRYNRAMAVGLRHNHDLSMILTKTKGLAMVFYITNYATKLDTPMWKRLVFAADVLRQLRESASLRGPNLAEQDAQRRDVVNESRQFLMRAANRIFSERQLSAVEVCYFLLGYQTDFTNVPKWSYINLTALYWTIFRRWSHLRSQACTRIDVEEPSETVQFRQNGRTLLYLDAYAYRGPILREICLYDYMSMITLERRRGRDEDEVRLALQGPPECHEWIQKLRQPLEYAVPIFQGFISDDHMDEHPVYFKRNSVLHLALFVPWEKFLSEIHSDITSIWQSLAATLCPRLRSHVANISLLRKSAEDARKDARLWASRSEGDDTVDVEFPLGEDDCEDDPTTEEPTMAEHYQNYTALFQTLQNAVRDSDATKDSPVLQGLIRDLGRENPVEERRPFIQRHDDFYQQIRHRQHSVLSQCSIPSADEVQAAAKAQDLLHLQMLNEIEGGVQGGTTSIGNTDIDDLLVRQCDADIPIPRQLETSQATNPRMLVELGPVGGFTELGLRAASTYTLNGLQSMALQLVCRFLDKYIDHPDSAGQNLQYVGGPGGTGKSRIVDALRDVFAARGQPHHPQITGTSGSEAAQIGGTTLHSACGLDIHHSNDREPPIFSEAKKWRWKQKLVLVIDEVSMLGGATLFQANCRLQALRDCPDKPFGGIPVVLLMGDFYQFAPVLEKSLLVDRMIDPAYAASLGQAAIAHHRGHSLWLMFRTVILLEEQVRARDDPQLGALLDRVRAGTQAREDFDLLNTRLVDRSQITFKAGLRAITPLNRNRWALNMEALVDWARFHTKHISIFISTHTWRSRTLSQQEVAQTIEQGDSSNCKIPGIFFYAQGMPVVVNKNTYTGLRVVNGAEFTAVDFIPDPKFPGPYLADDVTIHFGPPLGILLESQETKDLTIPTLPAGTLLIRPITHVLDPANSYYKFLSGKCTRRGLPVVPAFVLTDYKAQGKTFVDVLLELRGNRVANGQPSRCDFTSLYVQLSRCKTLQGIRLLNLVRPQDFLGNKPDQGIVDAMRRLTDLAVETRRSFESQQCFT